MNVLELSSGVCIERTSAGTTQRPFHALVPLNKCLLKRMFLCFGDGLASLSRHKRGVVEVWSIDVHT